MKKIAYILIFAALGACSTMGGAYQTDSTISKFYPSTNPSILQGLSTQNASRSASTEMAYRTTGEDFNLLERLKDTVWFQTEREYDDGKLEVETEFVFFNNNSFIVERESENGVMEAVEKDDYKKATFIKSLSTNNSSGTAVALDNTMLISVKEYGDELEYEGYYLVENAGFESGAYSREIFIVEGDTLAQAEALLKAIVENPSLAQFLDSDRYIISTKAQSFR